MKICSLCKVEKDVSFFGKHKRGKDGLRSRCKECNRIEANATYRRNPTPYKLRASKTRKATAAIVKAWLNEVKSKYGCVLCGEGDFCVLDFHHIRDKDVAVTTAIAKGISCVEDELAKSVVLCANCHRRVHAGKRNVDHVPTITDKFPRSENRRYEVRRRAPNSQSLSNP